MLMVPLSYRPKIPTTSRHGKSWFVRRRTWKVESTATRVLKPSPQSEAHMIDSWPSSRCCLVIGRSMPTWSFPWPGPRLPRWCVERHFSPGVSEVSIVDLRFSRSMSEALPASPPRSTSGPTTAPSRSRRITTTMSFESKYKTRWPPFP